MVRPKTDDSGRQEARHGRQKAGSATRRLQALATKNRTGSPAAFDHGPEATAARVPRDAARPKRPEAHGPTSTLSITEAQSQGPTEPNKDRTRQKTTKQPRKRPKSQCRTINRGHAQEARITTGVGPKSPKKVQKNTCETEQKEYSKE